MNEQNYSNLKTNVKKAFESNTEIAKGIKKALAELSEHFRNKLIGGFTNEIIYQ